ncbi:hypothetical protein CRYUN_Cryun16bG0020200 [Craigia yunnanensis]
MAERSSVTRNAMIKGYFSQRGRAKECCREALMLFRDMLNDVSGVNPTDTTMTWIAMGTGLVVHGRGKEALVLLDAMEDSGRAGHLKEAYDFFIEMPIKPDAILWRNLLSSCNIHGDVAMAEKVGKIPLRLEPPKSYVHMPVTSEDYVALSNIYASAGRWQQVELVRKKMKLKRIETKLGGSSIQTISNHRDGL